MLNKYLLTTLFLITSNSIVSAATLTLQTYYPSPVAYYNRLTLTPVTTAPDCTASKDVGTIFYDANDNHLKLCQDDGTGTFALVDTGGAWTQSSTDPYVYLTDPNPTAVNVGIGTSTPSTPLHIYASSSGDGKKMLTVENHASGSGTGAFLQLKAGPGTDDGGYIGGVYEGAGDGALTFWSSEGSVSAERMRINHSGYVGIGTAAPEFKLSLANDGGIIANGTFGSGATLTTSGAGTRMFWYPRKAAFRSGYVDGAQWDAASIGNYSFASGVDTVATGDASTAFGLATTASGTISTAGGNLSQATGIGAFSMGSSTIASGNYSAALGVSSRASATGAVAIGMSTTASGLYSFATGNSTTAAGDNSFTSGFLTSTTAGGIYAAAFGMQTQASGLVAFATGWQTVASGNSSTAMGNLTSAVGVASFASGRDTHALGHYSTTLGASNTVTAAGLQSTAIGYQNTVSGQNSMALGHTNTVSGIDSIAIGLNNTVSGSQSYAFGNPMVNVLGNNSMVLGVGHVGAAINMASANTIALYGGSVAIGTVTPQAGYALTVQGTVTKSSAGGSWDIYSDERLKDIEKPFSKGLKEIETLTPIHFHYKKDNPLNLPSDTENIGFVAQEVQKVIPEAVSQSGEYLSLNNDPIIWAMLNAIKELKSEKDSEIAELKSMVNSLKAEIEDLKKKIK